MMMRLALLATLMLSATAWGQSYDSLRLYAGTWEVSPKGASKTDRLVNECSLIGTFYGCQQTVNGKVMALILFIPRDKPGSFYTQGILQDGTAVGRGELEIAGDHWTYSSSGNASNYRTTNVFSGKDKIHFENSESPDGKTWKITGSGDEKRVAQ
jgi:hypothetical protein